MAEENNLLKGLNQAQIEAVLHSEGPLLIVAGAGSGKTRVLTHRVANLIANGTSPENVLAVTFTNKAAGEMKERISKILQTTDCRLLTVPWIGTFHSLCAWILRREAKHAGIPNNFTILDKEDSLRNIKSVMRDMKIDTKQFQPGRILAIISGKKNELSSADELRKDGEYFSRILADIWDGYENSLRQSGALDFDDLLLKTVLLLSENKQVLSKYQNLWKFVNIDEFQDTNTVQYILSKLLSDGHKNVCVVGDMDQSVYSFRGADFRNILNFERDFPESKVITLEQNYRSTETILTAANKVIEKNEERKPKNLYTKLDAGQKLEIFIGGSDAEEAEYIAQSSKMILDKNPKSPVAVLYRTNFQSRILEEKFLALQIPYQVVGTKFYERKEVKDLLAYIQSALNPKNTIAKSRIINTPTRGIGKILTAKYFSGRELSASEGKKVSDFEVIIANAEKKLKEKPISAAMKQIFEESGLSQMFDPSIEEEEVRLANVRELISLAKRFDDKKPPEGAEILLEEAALMSEQDNIKNKNENRVVLTTVHAAKGLEFDHVFISGLEDGLFPHTSFGGEDAKRRMEEERRLFYVALTRAKKGVCLSLALFRNIFGEKQANIPSRFLSDIPRHLIEDGDDEKEDIINI